MLLHFPQVGPAHNPTLMSRLDGLEVYACPKTDLVKEAAAVAEEGVGRAAAGNLESNLALAAISLPGHLMAPKPAQACSEYVLSQGLLTLTSLQTCLTGEPLPSSICLPLPACYLLSCLESII